MKSFILVVGLCCLLAKSSPLDEEYDDMDHSNMDHSNMDHSNMDHSNMGDTLTRREDEPQRVRTNYNTTLTCYKCKGINSQLPVESYANSETCSMETWNPEHAEEVSSQADEETEVVCYVLYLEDDEWNGDRSFVHRGVAKYNKDEQEAHFRILIEEFEKIAPEYSGSRTVVKRVCRDHLCNDDCSDVTEYCSGASAAAAATLLLLPALLAAKLFT